MEKDYCDFERTQQSIDNYLSDKISASGLQVTIDYLEFTLPIDYLSEEVDRMTTDQIMHMSSEKMREVINFILCMNMDDFVDLPAGRNGYLHQKKWGGGNLYVLYGAHPRQGVHVVMSGKGCRAYHSAVDNLQALVYRVMDFSGKVTRLDLALDDKSSRFYSVRDVLNRFREGEVVTRWHAMNIDFKVNLSQFTEKECLYFGSMTSDCFLRVYNKTLEQMVQEQASNEDFMLVNRDQMWTRWEFVLKKENAHNAAIQFVNDFGLGKLFSGLMANYFRVVKRDELSNDDRKRRWPTDPKWVEFMGVVEPLHVKMYKEKKDIESAKKWVQDQISPTLAAIMESDGGLDWIVAAIKAAEPRISPTMKAAIVEERKKKDKKNRPNLTFDERTIYNNGDI